MFLGLIRTVFKAPCPRKAVRATRHSATISVVRIGAVGAIGPWVPGKRALCTTWRKNTTLGSYIAYRGISSSKARAPDLLTGPFLKQPPGGQVRHCSSRSGGGGGISGGGGGGGAGGGGGGGGGVGGLGARGVGGTAASVGGLEPELEALFHGNEQFRASIAATNPGLLKVLASEGQRPPFMLLDCSDSRVGEQSIFSAKPGTMFTTGNIANQYNESDLNSKSVLSYAVSVLGVKHVIVMGHYGCGGVGAAIMRRPCPGTDGVGGDPVSGAVHSWIRPIRAVYQNSRRPEIVRHREKYGLMGVKEVPHLHDPAFRALVEENVKANVARVARSSVITNHYAALALAAHTKPRSSPSALPVSPTPKPIQVGTPVPVLRDVFIHGWVYDIETGEVADLGVSVGPPGREIPAMPFPRLVGGG